MFGLAGLVGPDEYIFVVENELKIGQAAVAGHLLFIPGGDSVKKILKTLGALE